LVTSPANGRVISLEEIADQIRTGSGVIKDEIAMIRNRIAGGADPKGAEIRERKKKNLPAFNLGTFVGGYRAVKSFQRSPIFLFDLDGISQDSLPSLRDQILKLPGLLLLFASPTATGLKFAILLDREITDHTEFSRVYKQYTKNLNDILGVTLDTTSDAARACYFSYDPDVFFNPEVKPVPVPAVEESRPPPKPEKPAASRPEGEANVDQGLPPGLGSELPRRALGYLAPDRADKYQSWLEVGMACHAAGLPCETWDEWSRQSKKYEEGACAAKWSTFDGAGGIGPGSLVAWADEDSPGWREVRVPQPALSPESIALAHGVEQEFGPPFCTSIGKDGDEKFRGLNESFWAGWHAVKHRELHDPVEQVFYRYDEARGIYVELSADAIKQELSRDILDYGRRSNFAQEITRGRSNDFLWAIVGHLRGIVEKRDAFTSERNFIVLGNGVLVFPDGGAEPEYRLFSPDYISRNASPICYQPDATCPRFLNELLLPAVTPEDAILIQKYVGLCLLGRNLIQRLLILDGLAGRGKSALAIAIQLLVGTLNCTQLRTQYLGDKFELFRMLRKTLLVGVDVNPDFLNTKGASVLKGLVGGDIFDAEQKGGTGSFLIEGTFCCIVTSNARLRVALSGDVGAWQRRLLIVRYEAPPPKRKIPDFGKILIREEGPGILNWAIEGLQALRNDIASIGDIALTEKQAGIVDALLCESDSLRHFLVARVVRDDAAPGLTVQQIINAYAEYCPERGWSALPITVIQRQLEGLMLELFRVSRSNSLTVDDKAARGFRNVRFADSTQNMPAEQNSGTPGTGISNLRGDMGFAPDGFPGMGGEQ
jgi:phage/plasmid-associated DNA primase